MLETNDDQSIMGDMNNLSDVLNTNVYVEEYLRVKKHTTFKEKNSLEVD